MNKRFISLLLVFVLLLSMTGCGNKRPEDGEYQIYYLNMSTPRATTSTDRARSATPWTSPCGRRHSPSTSCAGPHPGATASPDGTASARPWVRNTSASTSTSTVAAWTSCSPITSARLPRAWPARATTWCTTGCTTT